MTAAATTLQKIILDLIDQEGAVPFDRFMELALYHPDYGYYTRPRTRIGKEGDFFTSTSVHSLFGSLIARQLEEMFRLLGEDECVLVEQGGGEGHLALDILNELRDAFPDTYARLAYRMIELSPDNRARQAETLREHVAAGKVTWFTDSDLPPFTGCFISNELLDAFPVALVEKREGKLQEVYIDRNGEGLKEIFCDPRPQVSSHLEHLGYGPVEGNRGEVCLALPPWIEWLSGKLIKGFVTTIDYGHPALELYGPTRRDGTLCCYHRHVRVEDALVRIGEQDITAHVDLTTLIDRGTEAGLNMLYCNEQYRFLIGLGFVEELLRLQAKESDPVKQQGLRLTLKTLIMPDGGMGDTFKVVIQGKGVGKPKLMAHRTIHDIDPLALAGMMAG